MHKNDNPRINVLIAETLEIMRIMDSTAEEADCILWTGATGQSGHPIYKPQGCGCTLVRRAMFELTKGPLQPRVPIDTTCGERRCINPAHLRESTSQDIAKRAAKRGAYSSVSRASKIAMAKRAKGKLTIEQAREIRMSSDTAKSLAQRFSVDPSLIKGIKAILESSSISASTVKRPISFLAVRVT